MVKINHVIINGKRKIYDGTGRNPSVPITVKQLENKKLKIRNPHAQAMIWSIMCEKCKGDIFHLIFDTRFTRVHMQIRIYHSFTKKIEFTISTANTIIVKVDLSFKPGRKKKEYEQQGQPNLRVSACV